MDFTKAVPEKRHEVLYVRVKATNKQFIIDLAEYEGISESALVDNLLTIFREQNAGFKKKPKRERRT